MVHYLQYHLLCPWVLPKCKPRETEKMNDSNSAAKHACALCSCCPASVLVLNTEESSWSLGTSWQGESLVTRDCQLFCARWCRNRSLLSFQLYFTPNAGFPASCKTPLYTALPSFYFNFICKYWFISNSFCRWLSLVYVSFKSSACFEAKLPGLTLFKEPVPLELWLLDTDTGHLASWSCT